MILKAITEEELETIEIEGLDDSVKNVIREAVRELGEEGEKVDWVRGYLVQECEESIIDKDLIESLPSDACSFSEGWDCCLQLTKIGESIKGYIMGITLSPELFGMPPYQRQMEYGRIILEIQVEDFQGVREMNRRLQATSKVELTIKEVESWVYPSG